MNTGTLKQELEAVCRYIAETPNDNFSVIDGNLSNAVFYLQYARFHNNEAAYARFENILQTHIASISEDIGRLELGYGLTGLSWLLYAMRNEGIYTGMDLSAFDEIDNDILNAVFKHHNRGLYNYMEGGLGLALYFLEKTNQPETAERLSRIIDSLGAKAVWISDIACYWPDNYTSRYDNTPRKKTPYINLGMAHGLVSLSYFLARCIQSGVAVQKAQHLLNGLTQFLLQSRNDANAPFLYPNKILLEGDVYPPENNNRFSWCYGQLGIALAFYAAGKALCEEKFTALSREIALASAGITFEQVNRHMVFKEGVYDIYICHGMAGNAHLYFQLYKLHKDPLLLQQADNWLRLSLDYFSQYKTFDAKQTGILNGLPGIALILMDRLALEEAPPNVLFNWNRILLTDFDKL